MIAFRGIVSATVSANFGEIDINDGSLYLGALKSGALRFASQSANDELASADFDISSALTGDFWDGELDWNFFSQGDGNWEVMVSGRFAFEITSDSDLTDCEQTVSIEDLLIIYREDGDSPAVIAKSLKVQGTIEEASIDLDFDEL